MPGLATAANSRDLFIGTPPLTAATDKTITPTPVSKPFSGDTHSTFVEVGIKSNDNQNLAHTVLTVTIPTPTGLTVHTPVETPTPPAGADPCTTVTANGTTTTTCDYGSLGAFDSRTLAYVIDVASTFDFAHQAATFISATATTNNENGSNLQEFKANSGSFQVQDATADFLASWVPSGTNGKSFATTALGGDGAGNLSSIITFDASADETISLTDGKKSPSGPYQCPTLPVVLSCQDDYSEAVTTSGFFGSPSYFHWTLNALVPKTYSLSQGFVAHYPTGATTYDPTDPSFWTLFFKSKASFCGSLDITSNGHCIKTLTLTKYDKTFNKLTIELVMDHQGGLKY